MPGESAALRQQYGLDPDLPVILYVGRLDADKQVELVVQAAARLLQAGRAQLLVAGDGTRRRALIELSRALGISARVVFPGFVSVNGDLPGLYRLAAVFVSVCELETQCLTAQEALCSGVPVVTVKTDVMCDTIQDGVSGFLVPPGDTVAIAERIAYLLEYPELARQMGLNGEVVAMRYSDAQMVQEYEALYQAIGQGGTRRN